MPTLIILHQLLFVLFTVLSVLLFLNLFKKYTPQTVKSQELIAKKILYIRPTAIFRAPEALRAIFPVLPATGPVFALCGGFACDAVYRNTGSGT